MSSFDGFDIALFEGRYLGAFDLDDKEAAKMKVDDVVTFLVVSRLKSAVLAETPSGDLKRKNGYQVLDAIPLTQDQINRVTKILQEPARPAVEAYVHPQQMDIYDMNTNALEIQTSGESLAPTTDPHDVTETSYEEVQADWDRAFTVPLSSLGFPERPVLANFDDVPLIGDVDE